MAIDSGRTEPRSRRAILAGALGGVAAVVASRFASPDKTSAVHLPGFGHANAAGAANTSLTTSSTGTALLVTQNGSGTALRGSAVGAGSIAGFFTANNGTGISGVTGSGGSYGVFAQNNGGIGSGGALRASGGVNQAIVATSSASSTTIYSQNTFGTGIRGRALGTSGNFGAGVQGETEGEYGNGVLGYSNSPTGYPEQAANAVAGFSGTPHGNGVLGSINQANGRGVHGINSAQNGTAILGVNNSGGTQENAGYGIVGLSGGGVHSIIAPNGYWDGAGEFVGPNGVIGATHESNGVGVVGIGYEGTGRAGDFVGDVSITGTLTKGAGTFTIDHPLDPANKTLAHSFVESPDMMNVYNGNVTTDAKGDAIVKLPGYFGALNTDPRYQLTVVGSFAQAMVSAKIKDNAFSIKTDKPGIEVSWQVTGIRKDAYAEAHRVVVEATKARKGLYLHPVEHGQPASKRMGTAQQK